jgi:hypothetical protein
MSDETPTYTVRAREISDPPPDSANDQLLYRLIVGSLGATLLLLAVGGLVLAGLERAIPDGLIALGGGALGALAGTLVPRNKA